MREREREGERERERGIEEMKWEKRREREEYQSLHFEICSIFGLAEQVNDTVLWLNLVRHCSQSSLLETHTRAVLNIFVCTVNYIHVHVHACTTTCMIGCY